MVWNATQQVMNLSANLRSIISDIEHKSKKLAARQLCQTLDRHKTWEPDDDRDVIAWPVLVIGWP